STIATLVGEQMRRRMSSASVIWLRGGTAIVDAPCGARAGTSGARSLADSVTSHGADTGAVVRTRTRSETRSTGAADVNTSTSQLSAATSGSAGANPSPAPI